VLSFRKIDDAFKDNNLEQAKILLAKLKYYSSLEDKIRELKRRIGIVA